MAILIHPMYQSRTTGRASMRAMMLALSILGTLLLYLSSDLHLQLDSTFTWPMGIDGKITLPFNRTTGKINAPRHPIHDLVKQAEAKWDGMVKRQSKTLRKAVKEYQRRYGRMPPKGFDAWWKFATDNNVMLVDEFDQIDHDITPFLALPTYVIQSRLEDLGSLPFSMHMEIKSGDVIPSGQLKHDRRLLDVADLIRGFAHLLPRDMPALHLSGHDSGSQIFGEDLRQEVHKLLSHGQHLSPHKIAHFEDLKRNPRRTLMNACLDDSPAVLNATLPGPRPIQFIQSHRASMNFCQNPSLFNGHGLFWHNAAHGSKISPYFVMCKPDQGGELLIPALAGYSNTSSAAQNVPWSERTDTKLFWRGRTTGNHFNRERHWTESHRVALHILANSPDGDEREVDVVVEEGGVLARRTFSQKMLNDKYLDVGLAGKPTQCGVEDGTCAAMAEGIDFLPLTPGSAGLDGKYSLDVDGNGWSQRYRKLLESGSVVFKMTIFPEWNTDWLIPFYHYVPIQHDYSDLYNTLSFFVGSPNGGAGHDDMAERIAQHSVEFVRRNWRWEDLQAYMFRLLLEYARAGSLDRQAMTMTMREVI